MGLRVEWQVALRNIGGNTGNMKAVQRSSPPYTSQSLREIKCREELSDERATSKSRCKMLGAESERWPAADALPLSQHGSAEEHTARFRFSILPLDILHSPGNPQNNTPGSVKCDSGSSYLVKCSAKDSTI